MLVPVGKRVLIIPLEEDTGKIIVAKQKPVRFRVVSLSDEVTKVKPGDVIYLEKHYGVEIEHAGEKFQCIDESSILAKVQSHG